MMTTVTSKITGQIVHVSRRRFLSGTAGAIVATGATLIPQQTMAAEEPLSLEQMAHALHEAVGQYSVRNAEFDFGRHVDKPGPNFSSSLGYVLERMRHCSVDEIQCILKPLIGGVS